MHDPIVQFIVVAILCAIGLGVLSQFPNLDATAVKFVRLLVLTVLAILFLNLMLVLLLGHGLSFYTGVGR